MLYIKLLGVLDGHDKVSDNPTRDEIAISTKMELINF